MMGVSVHVVGVVMCESAYSGCCDGECCDGCECI